MATSRQPDHSSHVPVSEKSYIPLSAPKGHVSLARISVLPGYSIWESTPNSAPQQATILCQSPNFQGVADEILHFVILNNLPINILGHKFSTWHTVSIRCERNMSQKFECRLALLSRKEMVSLPSLWSRSRPEPHGAMAFPPMGSVGFISEPFLGFHRAGTIHNNLSDND